MSQRQPGHRRRWRHDHVTREHQSPDFPSPLKWIHDFHPRASKIPRIVRRYRQPMHQRRRGNQTILDRHRPPRCPQLRQQFRPSQTRRRFPRKAMNLLNPLGKPAFQTSTPLPRGQKMYPKSNLTQYDRIDRQVALVSTQPFQHPLLRRWLGCFTEDIGVYQINHSVSVDSDSMGTKKPFSGHASNQSITPSFGAGSRRLRR